MIDLREIDALIAEKVMGWHSVGGAGWHGPDVGCTSAVGFRPSTDMASAWQVVENLCADHAATFEMDRQGTSNYYAAFGWWDKEADYFECGYAESESAPMAICLAALNAKGVKL